MSLPSFVSTLPGSTRQFFGNIFHKKNSGLRAQQQQSQAPSSNNLVPTSTSSHDNHNKNINDSITNNNNNNNNNNNRDEKAAVTPPPISSTFLEKYPSLGSNNSSTFSVLLPPVARIADNLDYDYIHNNISSNTSSRGSGSGTPVSESPPKLLILPPRRSSIGASTSGFITPHTPTSGNYGASVASPAPSLTAAHNNEPKSPSPLSPRSENTVFTQATVTITFTKFITNPTIPAPALTVATAPSINITNNSGTSNSSSGLNSFHVDKDVSTEHGLLGLEALSPTTRKKKFDHFKFGRSSATATATGGGVAASILSNLAFTFKKQQNSNNNSSNNHSLSKLSLMTTQQQQLQLQQQQQKKNQQRQQDGQQSQPPQTLLLQQTLKSPRSQLFFMTARTKKESPIDRLASREFSSSSPSFFPDMSSSQATESKPPEAATTTTTTSTTTPATTTIKATTSRTAVTLPTRRSAVIKKKSLSRNLLSTKHTTTTVTTTDIPVPTPVTTAESELVPSPLSMMHWPILPEVVVIPDLPKYIPDDDFGRNAKRNEKYARIRLVALREHQQVLVGLLGDLLALDQQRREQQFFFKDPAHLVEKVTVISPSWKKQPTSGSASQPTEVLMMSSSKGPKTVEAVAGETDCECDCQKRRRRQLQKHDSATRAYQRAILDLWQTDENLCHWLSRYIRTTRHVGRGLDCILAAMAEDNNNSTSSGSVTSTYLFKCPVALGMNQEIVTGSRGVRVRTSRNERPASGVSNPELERMGILQSSLLGHSSTSVSLNDDSTSDSECQPQHLISGALISSELIMESATLGMIDIGLSTSMHRPEKRIPTIEVDSPEHLSQPLPLLPDCHRSSFTSITPNVTTTKNLPRTVVATMRRRPTRVSRLVTEPSLSQEIRELVTSSAPIDPPPAIPPPKRPKPPTYPINIPCVTRVPRIVSNSFFPSVPSPPPSAMITYSRTQPSFPLPPGNFEAGTFGVGAFRSSNFVRSPISNLAPILELDQDQQSQPVSLLQPCESESSRYSFASATAPAVIHCAEDFNDSFIPPPPTASPTTPTTSFPKATAPTSVPAATTTTSSTPKKPTTTNNATEAAQMMMMRLPETDEYIDIEASVSVSYHLQSVSKANEFLMQFNRESRRSQAVLLKFEAAKRNFEQRVLGLGLGVGAGGVSNEGNSEGSSDGKGVGSALR